MISSIPCLICHKGEARFNVPAYLYPREERRIYSCTTCGASYYWPVPTHGDIARCYPHAYFADFFRQYWKDYYKGRFLIGRLKRWRKKGVFLDVGCALGTLLAGVRDYSGWQVFGLEYMAFAAQAGAELNHVPITTGSLQEAPWNAGYFDAVYANNVLEHESDPVRAVRKTAALLNPGGRLYLTVPNGTVDLLPNKILYARSGKPTVTRHSGHLFFLSKPALRALLEDNGFRILSMKSFHFKSALKALGLTPGAYAQFTEPAAPVTVSSEPPQHPSVDVLRARIPARPNWPLYALQSYWRRAWRWPGIAWGYDFEILAEKQA